MVNFILGTEAMWNYVFLSGSYGQENKFPDVVLYLENT